MSTIINKLNFIRNRCSNSNIKNRVSLIINKIADITAPEDVSNTSQEESNEVITPLSILEDNTDEFLVLMRTLPEDHELKKSINTLDLIVNKIKSTLTDISSQLKEVISNDKEELPTGDLVKLSDLLITVSDEFSNTLELASIMESMAKQGEKEQKHKPVEHKLEKIKLGPKKKEEEEDIKLELNKSEEDKEKDIKKTVEKLDNLIKSK